MHIRKELHPEDNTKGLYLGDRKPRQRSTTHILSQQDPTSSCLCTQERSLRQEREKPARGRRMRPDISEDGGNELSGQRLENLPRHPSGSSHGGRRVGFLPYLLNPPTSSIVVSPFGR